MLDKVDEIRSVGFRSTGPECAHLAVRVLACLAATVIVAAGEAELYAQGDSTRGEPGGAPAWLQAWSPLAPVAEQRRDVPRVAIMPDILGTPAPRVGLLWTAGNPAALALGLEDEYGEMQLGGGGREGSYRRPFDEDGVRALQFSALRWQPVGERSGVIARVIADQTSANSGAYTGAVDPYSADPFVLTDTLIAPMRHLRVRLEGAYGWRFGEWGMGLGAGLEVSDDRTRESRLPRLGRSSVPAVSLGIARDVGPISLAAHGRWQGGRENLRLVAVPAVVGVVHQLGGFSEPERATFSNSVFIRRIERDAYAGGFAVASSVFGVHWTAFAERTRRRNRHGGSRIAADAPVDRWNADGWRSGGALTRSLLDDRLNVTATGEYSVQDGDAFRADLDGSIFRSRESSLRGDLDLRYHPHAGDWLVAARAEVRRNLRERSDFLVRVDNDDSVWTPAFAMEGARRVGSATWLSAGVGFAFQRSVSAMPDPESMGPIYRQILAPELALYADAASATALTASLRRQIGNVGLVLNGRAERAASAGEAVLPDVSPEGERTTWSLSFGAVWGGEMFRSSR